MPDKAARVCEPLAETGLTCASYLDFFDVGIPVSHLLHVVHQLAVHCVQGLVHHHLQSEHLAHVREHLALHFVSVILGEGKAELISQMFTGGPCHSAAERSTYHHRLCLPAVLVPEDAERFLEGFLSLLDVRHFHLAEGLLLQP